MPARKNREGEALTNWQTRKNQHKSNMNEARKRIKDLTGHMLIRPIDAAAMLNVTTKTLRELEADGKLPPRVVFSPKVFGWRLADLEATVRERMGKVVGRGLAQ
jgi:hypothetical protein